MHYSPGIYNRKLACYTDPSAPHAAFPPPTIDAPQRRLRARTLDAPVLDISWVLASETCGGLDLVET